MTFSIHKDKEQEIKIMTIEITPAMLYTLTNHFTYEACEAICEYYEECGDPANSPRIGDIEVGFCEVSAEDMYEEDTEMIVAELSNGNVLLAR